ncbi:hypothetical protein ADIS_3847 [Lunatimonas lonarensis]|uniref:DUF218 domain-containing protein n=1 Tax=Lunatimonas lonarensis TaxID=1232681 RepID=R7ZNP2_9BACT|nr:YdcF family protein [Lunatimonas lonarensis]EON75697.1 hypothetical protein ADIS_3847 [Lunatimonas lonarensis]
MKLPLEDLSPKIWNLARILWDYHHTNHTLSPADCILVLGSNDIRVAERGANLYLQGYAPLLVYSGGLGNFTQGVWDETEAEKFAQVAFQMGVPESAVLIENKSTNTGENLRNTQAIFSEKGLNPHRFILVQKPFMERRILATFEIHWPDKEVMVTSPQIPLEDYPNDDISSDLLINAMVGDLQRIKVYPEKGFQTYQEIPQEVWRAYEDLIHLGYDKHLIHE